MKTLAGIFNGTGADLYLCLGFVPDWVRLYNNEGTQRIMLEWNSNMQRSSEICDGVMITGASSDAAALTTGNGVRPYTGGTTLSSTAAGTTTYGEGVYLKRTGRDYRQGANSKPVTGDATSVTIDTWTLDTAGSATGHFNEDVTGTYIGEGSKIMIDGLMYAIHAVTASQGEGTDEVTLDRDAPSGDVQFISGMYDFVPILEGEVTLDGILISNTDLNVNDAIISLECGTYV